MPADLSDDEFLAAFLDARLEREDFGHRNHLRAAWLLLRRLPRAEAIETACRGIEALAARLGAADKFHRTRSEALMRLIASAAATAPDWPAFLDREHALVDDARGVLARHYSCDRLDSDEARRDFVAPDRLPLPR